MALCRQSCFSSCNRRRSKSSRAPDNADCLHDCLATPLPTLWILGLWKDCNRTTSTHPPALYLNLPAKSANERNVFVFSPPRGNHWRALRWQQEVDHPHSYKTAGPPPRSSFYLFLPRNSRSPASQPILLGKTLYTLSPCNLLHRLAKLKEDLDIFSNTITIPFFVFLSTKCTLSTINISKNTYPSVYSLSQGFWCIHSLDCTKGCWHKPSHPWTQRVRNSSQSNLRLNVSLFLFFPFSLLFLFVFHFRDEHRCRRWRCSRSSRSQPAPGQPRSWPTIDSTTMMEAWCNWKS